MLIYKPTQKIIFSLQRRNEHLLQENSKNAALIDYLAMMCDIDIDSIQDMEEHENEESEV